MAPSVPTAFARWRNVCRAVIPFLFTALVFSAGLLLFVRGFFLTRTQLDIAAYHSTCSCRPVNDLWGQRDGSIMSMCVPSPAVSDDTNQCWGPEAPDVQRHRFSKVVLLVVDALRFDFVLPSCSGVGDGGANVTGSDGDLAWQGQLPIFEELLRRQPDRALLYRASADPPTVTQQRLKALVAGGMPTFMDVRDSFASPRITEDNLVAQAAAQGWRFVGVGSATARLSVWRASERVVSFIAPERHSWATIRGTVCFPSASRSPSLSHHSMSGTCTALTTASRRCCRLCLPEMSRLLLTSFDVSDPTLTMQPQTLAPSC